MMNGTGLLLLLGSLVLLVVFSAGVFFRAWFTQGKSAGHNQFKIKLLPKPEAPQKQKSENSGSESTPL